MSANNSASRSRIYARGSRGERCNKIATWVSATLALATVVAVVWAVLNANHPAAVYFPVLALLWAVGPPVWFWYEYFFL